MTIVREDSPKDPTDRKKPRGDNFYSEDVTTAVTTGKPFRKGKEEGMVA